MHRRAGAVVLCNEVRVGVHDLRELLRLAQAHCAIESDRLVEGLRRIPPGGGHVAWHGGCNRLSFIRESSLKALHMRPRIDPRLLAAFASSRRSGDHPSPAILRFPIHCFRFFEFAKIYNAVPRLYK